MSFTSIIPKTDLNHILDVLHDLAESPSSMDVDGEPVASKLLSMEKLEVMLDDDISVEFLISSSKGDTPKVASISVTKLADVEITTVDGVYPEVRFRLYATSNHSLAWEGATTIQEVVTPERMQGMLRIASVMKARLLGLFDDESMI